MTMHAQPDGSREGSASGGPAASVKMPRVKPRWTTHMWALISCARSLGIDDSPAWVYGGTGHAFAMNVHKTLCPSGPTAWQSHRLMGAPASYLGLHVQPHAVARTDPAAPKRRSDIFQAFRKAIDAGNPAIGWEMDVPEWYPLTGYEGEHYLFLDFDGQQRKLNHAQLGDTEIGMTCVMTVARCAAADERVLLREAIRVALDNAAGMHVDDPDRYRAGLNAYDAWIDALALEDPLQADKVMGFGCAYNAAVWADCRRQVPVFLEEMGERLDEDEFLPLLHKAIDAYSQVAAAMDDLAELFPFAVDKPTEMDQRIADKARRQKGIRALNRARHSEEAGLTALGKLADALDAHSARHANATASDSAGLYVPNTIRTRRPVRDDAQDK